MQLSIYCDGGARGNPGPAASAFVIKDEKGRLVASRGVYIGNTTNNQAEYKAVLFAFSYLEKEKENSIDSITFFLDSELVAHQLAGRFKIRNKNLQPLAMTIKRIEQALDVPVVYRAIPREKNKEADALVNNVLDRVGKR